MLLDPARSAEYNELKVLEALKGIRLICELPLDEGDRDHLARFLSQVLTRRGASLGTEKIFQSYSAQLVAFLVLQGIYGYSAGDYWTDVCERVGLPPGNYPSRWGRQFRAFLTSRKLPDFADAGGRTYIVPILTHGGIPSDALPHFFRQVVLPALRSGASAEDVIETLRHREDGIGSRPVIDFLRHGGDFARDFLDRALQMARDVLVDGGTADAADLGLPHRVVDRFSEWSSSLASEERPASSAVGLRRPYLFIDPWGAGVCLQLPAQEIEAGAQLTWVFAGGGQSKRVQVLQSRQGRRVLSEAETLPIETLAERVTVRLEIDGRELRSWDLRCLPPQQPFLLFDADSGRVGASGDRAIVVVARGAHLKRRDGAPVTWDEPYSLPFAWSGCEAGLLSDLSAHLVERGDKTRVDIAPECRPQLRLKGGTRVDTGFGDADLALYSVSPPVLVIPGDGTEVAGWRIQIRPLGAAHPPHAVSLPLGDVEWSESDDAIHVRLDQPALLGTATAGVFQIGVRRFLGGDMRVQLAVVPHLQIVRRRHGTRTQISLRAEDARVRVFRGDQELSRDGGQFDLPDDPDQASHNLRVQVSLAQGAAPAVIPLRIRIDQWRWRLLGVDASLESWRTRTFTASIDDLRQFDHPTLLIDLSPATPPVEVELIARAPEDRTLLARQAAGRGPWVRFELGPFIEEMRACNTSARFVVEVREGSVPVFAEELFVLREDWNVTQPYASCKDEDGQRSLHLRWSSPRVVPHRQARLWSRWRPWESPVALDIPEEAGDRHTFRVEPERLAPGSYMVEMRTVDPWARTRSRRPEPDAANVTTVEVGDSAMQDLHLESLPPGGCACMERYLASAARGAPEARALYPLRETLGPDDVPTVLQLLLSLPETPLADDEHAIILTDEFLRPFLLEKEAATFLKLLVDELVDANKRTRRKLRLAAVRVGLICDPELRRLGPTFDASLRESLWDLWSPLGCLFVTDDVEAAYDVYAAKLGEEQLVRILFEDPVKTAAFGSALGQELAMPPEWHESMLSDLIGTPASPVESRAQQAAYANYLLHHHRMSARPLVEDSSTLEAWLSTAVERDWVERDIVAALELRKPKHRSHPKWKVQLGPWCVGAVAILAHVLGTSSKRRKVLGITERDLLSFVRRADRTAPYLFDYDLTVSHLLMRRPAFSQFTQEKEHDA